MGHLFDIHTTPYEPGNLQHRLCLDGILARSLEIRCYGPLDSPSPPAGQLERVPFHDQLSQFDTRVMWRLSPII